MGADGGRRARVCQVVNDAIAEDAKRYPGRMVGMAIVPFQDVGEAIYELDRVVKEHGMRTVLIPASHHGKNLTKRNFFQSSRARSERGVLIFIHPHEVAAADRLKKYALANLIGNPLENHHRASEFDSGGGARAIARIENLLRSRRRLFAGIRGRWRHGQSSRYEARGGDYPPDR